MLLHLTSFDLGQIIYFFIFLAFSCCYFGLKSVQIIQLDGNVKRNFQRVESENDVSYKLNTWQLMI